MVTSLNFHKVAELPAEPEPNAIYFRRIAGTERAEQYVADELGRAIPVARQYDARDFGVRTDGLNDNTAVLQSMIDLVVLLGVSELVLPAGEIRLDGEIRLPFDLTLRGAGIRKTRIVSYGRRAIRFVGGSDNGCAKVCDLTIAARIAASTTDEPDTTAGYALKFEGLRSKRQGCAVDRVRIESFDGVLRTWGHDRAIWVHDLMYGTIGACYIDGSFVAVDNTAKTRSLTNPIQKLQTAIVSTGVTTGLVVNNGTVISAYYRAVLFSGTFNEGPRFTDIDIVGVYYGIMAPDFGGRPGFWIRNIHINALRVAVFIERAVDVSIDGVYAYRAAVFWGDGDWTGVHLKECLARTTISKLHTSISLLTFNRFGLVLQDCIGVVATKLMLSQVDRAIEHRGANSNVVYEGVVFNGLSAGGASGTALTLSATDSAISFGRHTFHGSYTTKYVVPVWKGSIRIDDGRRGGHGSLPGQTLSDTIPAATPTPTKTFRAGADRQSQGVNLAAPGSGSYTAYLDFDKTDVNEGNRFQLLLTLPAPATAGTANVTAVLRNGLAGATLRTITNASGGRTLTIDVEVSSAGEWWITRICQWPA